MSFLNRVFSVVAAGVLMVVLSACGSRGGKPHLTQEEIKEQGLAYLEERYGMEFTFIGHRWGIVGATGDGFTAYMTGGSKSSDVVDVYWNRTLNGGGFHDNYLLVKYRDRLNAQLEAVLAPLISSAFPENDFRVAVNTVGNPKTLSYPDSFDEDTDFEEVYEYMLSQGSAYISVEIPDQSVDYSVVMPGLLAECEGVIVAGGMRLYVLEPTSFEQRHAWLDSDRLGEKPKLSTVEITYETWGK